MHHGTCVTHAPWFMSGSLTRGGGENVPGIPGACAPAILRIWPEAHGIPSSWSRMTLLLFAVTGCGNTPAHFNDTFKNEKKGLLITGFKNPTKLKIYWDFNCEVFGITKMIAGCLNWIGQLSHRLNQSHPLNVEIICILKKSVKQDHPIRPYH